MSSMTTNTSAPRISASEARRREAVQARAAGWTAADLRWERLTEAGVAAFAAGRRTRARALLIAAHWQARAFPPTDRRRATALANLALSARTPDRRRLAEALRLWQSLGADIEAAHIAPVTRSSLYHLRMEARHRDTYLSNARKRLATFATEAGETLAALAEGREAPHRHATRWRGERPPNFDDRRKILAACLLLCGTP